MTDALTYPTFSLCAVAGCLSGTFNTWRSRYGFLPRLPEDGLPSWTVTDICKTRLVVLLVNHGLPAKQACGIAQDCIEFDLDPKIGEISQLLTIWKEGDIYRARTYSRGIDHRMIFAGPNEVLTIVNLTEIVLWVRNWIDAGFVMTVPGTEL